MWTLTNWSFKARSFFPAWRQQNIRPRSNPINLNLLADAVRFVMISSSTWKLRTKKFNHIKFHLSVWRPGFTSVLQYVSNSQSSLRTWESNYVTVNQMTNFETNLWISRRTSWEWGTAVSFCNCSPLLFQNECLHQARKAIPSFVWPKNYYWKPVRMERTLSNRTGTETSKQTIANLVDNFIRRANIEANKGRNKTQCVLTMLIFTNWWRITFLCPKTSRWRHVHR